MNIWLICNININLNNFNVFYFKEQSANQASPRLHRLSSPVRRGDSLFRASFQLKWAEQPHPRYKSRFNQTEVANNYL